MGEDKARRVFMSARLFSTTEAIDLNLVAKSVGSSELDDAVEAEILPYLQCAPGAVGTCEKARPCFGPNNRRKA